MSRLMKLFEILRQAPKDRKLEGKQVEKKSEAARTKLKKLIRRTSPSGHGSICSGPKWHADKEEEERNTQHKTL